MNPTRPLVFFTFGCILTSCWWMTALGIRPEGWKFSPAMPPAIALTLFFLGWLLGVAIDNWKKP